MTELAFDDTGTGTGRPLLFLHGIVSRRSAWQPVVDRLSARHRCVNVDLLGHGDSPRDGAYDVFTQTAAVEGLISDLRLDRPVLVGHSYGAFIATLAGASAPVGGVVNFDQELDTAAFKSKISPYEARLRGEDFEAAFNEFTQTLQPDLVPEERRQLAAMPPDSELVLGVWTTIFDTPAADLNALVQQALSGYPVPYLAIFGSSISAEERRLLETIPDVEIEQWDGLGHFPHLVEPGRAADRISRFVSMQGAF